MFELQVHTTGWVAFGFSPHAKLSGSDIVIGAVFPNGSIYFSVSWKDFLCVPLCQRSFSKYTGLKAHGLNWLKIDVWDHMRSLVGMASDWQSRRAQVFCRSSVMPACPITATSDTLWYPRWHYIRQINWSHLTVKAIARTNRYDWSNHPPWS